MAFISAGTGGKEHGMKNYIFYDLETGGLDTRMDRIMQFAAIRTDENFNPIGEPLMLYCRQPDFYIPEEAAVSVTGITKEICEQRGLPEYRFAKRIHDFFTERPDTIILGFNNIKFDDEFIRNLFYRNFLPPYEYTFKKGNSRWDLLNLVRAAAHLRPDGIVWPRDEDGRLRLKLDRIAPANNITHTHAHDALSDVEATIAVAKLLKEKQPRLFEFAEKIRTGKVVGALFDAREGADIPEPVVTVGGGGVRLLMPLTFSKEKGRIFMDLTARNDAEKERLREQLYAWMCFNSKILSDALFRKIDLPLEVGGNKLDWVPMRIVRDNSCPFYAPASVLPDTEEYRTLRKNYNDLAEYLAYPRGIGVVRMKASEIARESEFEDAPGNKWVEGKLYSGGFPTPDEMFHNDRRVKCLETGGEALEGFIRESDGWVKGWIGADPNAVLPREAELSMLFLATHMIGGLSSKSAGYLEERVIAPRRAFYAERAEKELAARQAQERGFDAGLGIG